MKRLLATQDPRFLSLILLATLIRIFWWSTHSPQPFLDTNSYMDVARALAMMDFDHYLGERPPGYPLLLALAGMDFQKVFVLQLMLGVGTTGMLWWLFLRVSRSTAIAFWTGMLHSLNLAALYFEMDILSETLSTFLLCLSLVLLFKTAREDRQARYWLFTGISVSLLGVTRPQYQLLPLVFLALLIVNYFLSGEHRGLRKLAGLAGVFVIPMCVILGGWSLFNMVKINYFGITTFAGGSLMEHAGKFIESAPNEYAVLRDIYIMKRRERGTDLYGIWFAYPDMMRATGQSFVQLSKTLARMSVRTIINNPLAYVRSVFQSSAAFWGTALYPGLGETNSFLQMLMKPYSVFHEFVIVSFLILSLYLGIGYVKAVFTKQFLSDNFGLVSMYACIVYTLVVTSLVSSSENARFKAGVEPLIIGIVVMIYLTRLQNSLHHAKARGRAGASSAIDETTPAISNKAQVSG